MIGRGLKNALPNHAEFSCLLFQIRQECTTAHYRQLQAALHLLYTRKGIEQGWQVFFRPQAADYADHQRTIGSLRLAKTIQAVKDFSIDAVVTQTDLFSRNPLIVFEMVLKEFAIDHYCVRQAVRHTNEREV